MGWETINGRRYFYETVYEDGKRIRYNRGCSLEAMRAAERVEKAQQARRADIAWVKAAKARDQQLDQQTASLDARIRKTIQSTLNPAGYHYLRGQWRKIHKSKMNAQTNLVELKNEVLHLNQVETITPQESEEISAALRRIAMEALHGIPRPKDGPRVTLTCKIDETIAEVEAKVKSMREEFQYEHANPFDKLVIDQLTTAWVQWFVAGWLLEGELVVNRTWRQNQYLTNRYNQCQSRLTKAIDQLTRIRQIPNCELHIVTQVERDARNKEYDERQARFRAELESQEDDKS